MEPLDASRSLPDRLRALVEEHRAQCLWFLREDYFPSTAAEGLRVLDSVERYGDLAAFRETRELRGWLLRLSSATSVV